MAASVTVRIRITPPLVSVNCPHNWLITTHCISICTLTSQIISFSSSLGNSSGLIVSHRCIRRCQLDNCPARYYLKLKWHALRLLQWQHLMKQMIICQQYRALFCWNSNSNSNSIHRVGHLGFCAMDGRCSRQTPMRESTIKTGLVQQANERAFERRASRKDRESLELEERTLAHVSAVSPSSGVARQVMLNWHCNCNCQWHLATRKPVNRKRGISSTVGPLHSPPDEEVRSLFKDAPCRLTEWLAFTSTV